MSLSKIPFRKSDYFFFRPFLKGSYRGNVIFGPLFKTTNRHITKELIKQTTDASLLKICSYASNTQDYYTFEPPRYVKTQSNTVSFAK